MTFNEIQKLKQEIENLKRLAYKDELTGLYNRRGFSEIASRFVHELKGEREDKHKRKGIFIKNFALVMFDIDNFKKFNDNYGHSAGDKVLKKVAKIIKEGIRNIDIAGRWGGEELIIGLVGANCEDAFKIADGIRETINRKELEFNGEKVRVSVSGGISDFDEAQNLDNMIEKADKKLYKAKKSGKNKVILSE